MTTQVEFFDLIHARARIIKLNTANDKAITLINAPGSIRFLGALAIDKIFQILTQEFAINGCIFRVDDDLAGLFQAINMGYKNILYAGNSQVVKKIIQQIQ